MRVPAWQLELMLCQAHYAGHEDILYFKELTVRLNHILLTGCLVAAQPLA